MARLYKTFLGEELVADKVKETDKVVVLKNILRVFVIPGNAQQQKGPSVGFGEYLPYVQDEEFEFPKDYFVHMDLKPVQQMAAEHDRAFSNIIQPVNKGQIILPGGE